MKKADILIVLGVALIPAAFSAFCICVWLYEYETYRPFGSQVPPDTSLLLLALAAFVVAAALALVSAGILLRKRGT